MTLRLTHRSQCAGIIAVGTRLYQVDNTQFDIRIFFAQLDQLQFGELNQLNAAGGLCMGL